MKYYVNKKTMMLGSDDKTYWLDSLDDSEWFPLSAKPRFQEYLINSFSDDLHTFEYDDETKTCDEITTEGRNYTSSLEEKPDLQEIVDLFNELKEAQERYEELILEEQKTAEEGLDDD